MLSLRYYFSKTNVIDNVRPNVLGNDRRNEWPRLLSNKALPRKYQPRTCRAPSLPYKSQDFLVQVCPKSACSVPPRPSASPRQTRLLIFWRWQLWHTYQHSLQPSQLERRNCCRDLHHQGASCQQMWDHLRG